MNGNFFLPYQKKWILDNSRIKIMEKSRQIGMSWTAAYSLVRSHSKKSAKLDSWVSSRDETQARLFIEDCKKFAKILNLAVSEISGSQLCNDSESTSKILAFANNTRINSLSSNPDAQAGKRGTRVLDEFALHPDPKKLYAIAYPGITWGGSLEIISTHRGKENFFNKLIEEIRFNGNPKKISIHRVTLQDALEQGFLKKLKANLTSESPIFEMDESEYFNYVKNSCADYPSFMQEYMCEPFDDSSAFLTYDSLLACSYKQNQDWTTASSGDLFLGIDVGRAKDLSVFWLVERLGDTLYTREIKTFQNVKFSEQEIELFRFLQNPKLRKVCIDQTGIGRQFAERAAERFGESRVEGISFTLSSKEELAYPLKARFEDAKIRIPNETEIFSDLRGVKKQTSSLGGVRFVAESTKDGHSDRFWALALANFAALNSNSSIELIQKSEKKIMW